MSIEADIMSNQNFRNLSLEKQDATWILSLYGTAIGAGTLFLPINAGLNGILPLIIISLLAFPMTYFSHKSLCSFILSGSSKNDNINEVLDEHFGVRAGYLLTTLYFFSIFPILLMYSVAITNTTQSFLLNQLHIIPPARSITALILIVGLMLIIRMGQQIVIKAMSYLVYPFITILILLSLYLVPYWNMAIFNEVQVSTTQPLWMSLWLLVPVVIFSFNHSPIISSFAVNQKKQHNDEAHAQSSKILKFTHILMVLTVLFFVFSCVLSLEPANLAEAKQQNISILSYLANHFKTPLIAYIAPIIAFIAIAKSYLGHYLGVSEGLTGILLKSFKRENSKISYKLSLMIDVFIIFSCWIIATLNPNILTLIETLVGPIIAMFLFLMPVYAFASIPNLKKYFNPLSHSFTFIIGLIGLSAILYGLHSTIFS